MNNRRLLYGTLSKAQASFEVHAKATYYPHAVSVFEPAKPYQKLKPGLRLSSKPQPRKGTPKTNQEDNGTRSLRRTRKSIRDYVLCNEFELFVTFTFADERQDEERCRVRMSNWLKNQQKRSGSFSYLIVPERHKDGALHFHALLKGYKGEVKPSINPETGKQRRQRGRPVYTLPSYRSGFTNVKKIKATPESHSKVATYISKYITKDMPLFANKNRYWASLGLKIPDVVYNPDPWYLKEEPVWSYESDYGKTMVFAGRSKFDKAGEVVGLMEQE